MPTNLPIGIADAVMELLRGAGVEKALALIVAKIPLLGWGPIGWIVAGLVNWVAGYIYTALEKFVSFNIIDYEVIAENENYQAAVLSLQSAQASNSAADISLATSHLKDTLSKLIHFDGS